jgi:hypothetical protein
MKKIYILILLTFAYTAGAAVPPDLTGVRAPSSTDLNLDEAEKYQAKNNSNYLGRNSNNSESTALEKVDHSGNISKSVSKTSSSKQAQMENLESTAGEFIQKLEEDRFKKSKGHEKVYQDTKAKYTNAYTNTKKIDTSALGNEQDPYVQNAFKCENLKNCNRGINDPHAVPTCTNEEVLHWSGKQWTCLGQFKNPDAVSCDSDQWAKKINNGTACVDYVYDWVLISKVCGSNNKEVHTYQCQKKKTASDKTGTATDASKCLTANPSKTIACKYVPPYASDSSYSGSDRDQGGKRYRSRETGRSYRDNSNGRDQERRDIERRDRQRNESRRDSNNSYGGR